MENLTLEGFLIFAGSVAGVGAILSFALERLSLFTVLSAGAKAWITFVISFLVPIGAMAIRMYVPPEWLTEGNVWFQMIVIGFAVWTASQGAHGVDINYVRRRGQSK